MLSQLKKMMVTKSCRESGATLWVGPGHQWDPRGPTIFIQMFVFFSFDPLSDF